MNFLKKYQNLINSLPHLYAHNYKNVNSPYAYRAHEMRNCYFAFDGGVADKSCYIYNFRKLRDCVDCTFSYECELCYECIDCLNCYDSSYLIDCQYCSACHFCYSCRNCQSCFGCVLLQHKKYCVFNKQYSKNEYFEIVNSLKNKGASAIMNKVASLRDRLPFPLSYQYKTINCPYGDYILQSKNCYYTFDGRENEDCAYLFQAKNCKNSFDQMQSLKCELCYECDAAFSYKCSYLTFCVHMLDCHFCYQCGNCQNCWGCVNLNNAKFCILNKQYREKEYWQLVACVRKELGWPPERGLKQQLGFYT